GPNIEQGQAIQAIPEDIAAIEHRFNLDVKTTIYAVTADLQPCGTILLNHGKPIKIFEYYSFFDWFGRFLALPGVEQYADRFCDAVTQNDAPSPVDKQETSDGDFYRHAIGPDGRLFIAERGGEGRFVFLLHADFFNIEGNLKGGKHSSTGVMSLSCLNLPLEMREDPLHIWIPGVIQGPREPNVKLAHHRHYLKPVVDEILLGYQRGFQCHSTYDHRGDG
ncbi:hypothetical protein BT96DRAFT_787897, partial [Gymnopus androsaceus JB14]